MNREVYNSCMSPYMKGPGKSKEERHHDMCIGAKLCSQKAQTEEEAEKLCAEAAVEAATNPKPTTKRKSKCAIDINALAICVIKGIADEELTLANLSPVIAGCAGQKPAKTGREAFIKKCFKENASSGQVDIKEGQKLRSMCSQQWKEEEEGL